MALRVTTMTELRLDVLLEPERTGETIAQVCRRPGLLLEGPPAEGGDPKALACPISFRYEVSDISPEQTRPAPRP
jgi:hypothetical protein